MTHPDASRDPDPPAEADRSDHSTVVGIGASAGGLAALKTSFAPIPAESGVAWWWWCTCRPSTSGAASSPEASPGLLSPREEEVLRGLAWGHSNKQVGELLGISTRTVETYRARIADKLGLRERTEFVRYALEQGGPGRRSRSPPLDVTGGARPRRAASPCGSGARPSSRARPPTHRSRG